VSTGGVDALRFKPHLALAIKEEIRGVALPVAAFHHDRARAEREDLARRGADVVIGAQRMAHEHLGLGQVWGDDRGERQQLLDERADRILAQQAIAALGDHHRIDDEYRPKPPAPHAIGDRADDRRA